MIRQGPPEGDRMANGRVEMAVREVKRQCGTIRICAERNTSVRIADDCPLLTFCSASHENWQRRKDERNEENWSKMEKANGASWRESLVS